MDIKRLLTHIHFWIWSATFSSEFKKYRLQIRPLIGIYIRRVYYPWAYLEMRISYYIPDIIYDIPYDELLIYCRHYKLNPDWIFPNDIPF